MCSFFRAVIPVGTQLGRRHTEMFLAESGHVIDRKIIFISQFDNGDMSHDNVPEEILFLFLYQPLTGRLAERLPKFALEHGRRHVELVYQFLGGLYMWIELQDSVLEVVIHSQYRREESSQMFFVVKRP